MKNKFFLILTLALAMIAPARAATHTWTGGGSDENWGNPANWSGGQPVVGEAAPVVLIFTTGVTTTNNINGLVVDSLQFHADNAAVYASGIGTLTIRGGNSSTNLWFKGNSINFSESLPVSFSGTNLCVIGSAKSCIIPSALSGSGNVIWGGGGIVQYTGSAANTLSGTTWLRDATLVLDKPAGVNAIAGPLVLEDSPSGSYGVTLDAANQIADNVPVTMGYGKTFFAPSFNEKLGALTFRGGYINLVNGVLTLGGNVNVISNTASILSPLSLGGATRTFTIATNSTFTLYDIVSDGGAAAGINVTGGGNLTLLADNSFTGSVLVTNSLVTVQSPLGLGTAAAGTFINSNSTLNLLGANVAGEALTLAGTMQCDYTNTWGGTVTLQTGADFDCKINTQTTLSGVVSGSAALVKNGPGTLVLAGSAANTYSGGTEVWAGNIYLSKTNAVAIPGSLRFVYPNVDKEVRLVFPNQIANSAAVTLTNQSTLNLAGNSDSIGSLSGSSGLIPTTPPVVALGTGTLTNGIGTFTTFGGIITGNGPIALVKTGSGTLTLNGTNTCTGACLLNQGTLTVNGTLPGAITQSLNTYLTGTGTVGQVTCNSGFLQPAGLDQGRLNTGGLIFNSSSAVAFMELGPTTNDVINVTGSVTLNNCSLAFDSFTSGNIGKKFTLIANDGADAISGTFNGLPEGATIPYGSLNYTISYVGGTGNDVVLTQTTQPAGPQISSITKQVNGQMVINGHTENGAVLDVLAATNLPSTNWVNLGVSYADGFGAFTFTDTNAVSFKQRFYRFKMQ